MSDDPDEVGARWFEKRLREDGLQQGDQLWGFERLEIVPLAEGGYGALPVRADVVVLTQSCDLEHQKAESILIAQMGTLSEWIMENPQDLARLEDIRQGYDVSLYLLPGWSQAPHSDGHEDRIMDFSRMWIVKRDLLDAAIRQGAARLGMRSPARERLAQAVARTFMRVGLPLDIPSYALEKPRRDDGLLKPSALAAEVLEPFGVELTRDLPIFIGRRLRPSTGDEFYQVSVRQHQPSIFGSGKSVDEASRSLLKQLSIAWRRVGQGDVRYGWLTDFLTDIHDEAD